MEHQVRVQNASRTGRPSRGCASGSVTRRWPRPRRLAPDRASHTCRNCAGGSGCGRRGRCGRMSPAARRMWRSESVTCPRSGRSSHGRGRRHGMASWKIAPLDAQCRVACPCAGCPNRKPSIFRMISKNSFALSFCRPARLSQGLPDRRTARPAPSFEPARRRAWRKPRTDGGTRLPGPVFRVDPAGGFAVRPTSRFEESHVKRYSPNLGLSANCH
jgi:hypothetical protein